MLNGKPVKDIEGIAIGSFGKKTSVLSIDSLSEVHAGNVTCLAANKAGISAYTTELIIKGTYFTKPCSFSFSYAKNHSFLLRR